MKLFLIIKNCIIKKTKYIKYVMKMYYKHIFYILIESIYLYFKYIAFFFGNIIFTQYTRLLTKYKMIITVM